MVKMIVAALMVALMAWGVKAYLDMPMVSFVGDVPVAIEDGYGCKKVQEGEKLPTKYLKIKVEKSPC